MEVLLFLNQLVLIQDVGKDVMGGASNSRVRYPHARIASKLLQQFYEQRGRGSRRARSGVRVPPLLSLELGRDAMQISVLAPIPCGQDLLTTKGVCG